jgi:Plasmid pRiA4b ORF-3-like protein
MAKTKSPPKAKAAKNVPTRIGPKLFQFRITLDYLDPKIWRRVIVPDGSLEELNLWIQAAFSWTNSHLHEFTIKGKRYASPSPWGDDFEAIDDASVLLSELLPAGTRKSKWATYVYDFGDYWSHTIHFEGHTEPEPKQKYPICLEGENNGPPDDCGGPGLYPDYVEAVTNKKHPEHHEMIEWGGRFDPFAFDAAKTTKRMRNGF